MILLLYPLYVVFIILEPRVLEGFVNGDALGRVLDEHLPDQVFAGGADRQPDV
jgi:hypothetical protein